MIIHNNKEILNKKWVVYKNSDFVIENDSFLINISELNTTANFFSLTRFVFENKKFLLQILSRRTQDLFNKANTKFDLLKNKKFHVLSMPFMEVSGLTENCDLRNPNLNIYFQTIALEALIEKYKPRVIKFYYLDQLIIDALQKKFFNYSINIEVIPESKRISYKSNLFLLTAFTRFFHLFFTIISIKFFSKKNQIQKDHNSKILLISYLSSLNVKDNKLASVYWASLVEYLSKNNLKTHLLYLNTNLINSPRYKKLNLINENNSKNKNFILSSFDEFLTFKNLYYSLLFFFKIRNFSFKINKFFDQICEKQHEISPWPFMKNRWDRYTKAGTSVNFIMQVLQFNDFIINSKEYDKVIFLWEGMLWEKIFTYFWKKHKKTPIYGYQHTILKNGDIRGLKTNWNKGSINFYPNKLLYTGEIFKKQLNILGFNNFELYPVEALRYLYLKNQKEITLSNQNIHMLLLEGNEKADLFLLSCFKNICSKKTLKKNNIFLIKPHPNSDKRILGKYAKDFDVHIYSDNISKALSISQYVYTSLNSSAALESLILGKSLILFQMPDVLIRTPLYKFQFNQIITNAKNIDFNNIDNNKVKVKLNSQHLFMNQNINKWKSLLNET